MATDSAIISNLTQELKARIIEWYGPGSILLDETPIRIDRVWSLFFHFTAVDATGKEIPLIIKMFREDYMHTLNEIISSPALQDVAVREAETLNRIEAATIESGLPGLATIHCPGVLKSFSALAMEEGRFQTFKKKNYSKLPPFTDQYWKTVDQEIYRAGQWVKIFHTAFGKPETSTIEKLNQGSIDQLFTQLHRVTGKKFPRLQSSLQTAYDSVKDHEVPVTMLHYDLHLNNIFIDSDSAVGGFDPVSGQHGAVYHDLAQVLTDTSSLRRQILSQGLIFNRRFNERIKVGFLRGYGSELNEEILNFYCLLETVRLWLDQEKAFNNSWLKPWVRWFFLRTLQWYLPKEL